MVVLAPRLSHIADALKGKQTIGTIATGYTKHPNLAQQQLSGSGSGNGLYEYDNNESDTQDIVETLHETDIRYNSDECLAIVHLPLLEPRDCYTFTTELLKLNPKQVVLLCPCNMTSTVKHNVYSLATTSASGSKLATDIPPVLTPPFMISGASASILSRCQQTSIPALSLVLPAEGPEGHECIDFDSVAPDACAALTRVLGLKDQINVKPEYDRSLYI